MPLDLYSLPHKALRDAMAAAGAALGAQAPGAVDLAGAVLVALDEHGRHEDEFIHPLVRRHLPDVAAELDRQHEALHAMVDATAGALATTAGYRAFQRLTASNLDHLDHEESFVLPRLWAAVPDPALAELFDAFRAAHPEAREIYVRWPGHLSLAERDLVGLG